MKSLISKSFSVLFILIFLVGCKKDELIPSTTPNEPSSVSTNSLFSGIPIFTTIGGKIIDESNNPVVNAFVTVGNKTTYSDADGIFIIQNTSVDSDRAYVKVEKDGYFLGSRAIKPSSSASSFVKIKLLLKSSIGSITNSTGGVISIPNGPTLTFESNDISLSNGNSYSGGVTVYAAYIDPSASDLGYIMPGNLGAVNSNGEAVVLKSYGMIAVELVGSNGESLNIAAGQTVQISMPILASQAVNAPSSLPLWHFNENVGCWIEEGSATIQGNEYIGEVSHFSLWNFDGYLPSKSVKMSLTCSGFPIINGIVGVTDQTQGTFYGYFYTNSAGEIDELVPADLSLNLSVQDECGFVFHSENIGSGNTDVDLGVIEACSPNNSVFTATVVNCSAVPIPNALVRVKNGGNTFFLTTEVDGTLNSSILVCGSSDLEVTAFDEANNAQSSTYNIAISSTINAGNIVTCDLVNEYFQFTINGNTTSILDLGNNEVSAFADIGTGDLYIEGIQAVTGNNFYLWLTSPMIGLNSPAEAWAYYETSPGVWWSGTEYQNIIVNITSPNINGPYIEGTISGTITDDANGDSVPVSGNFRALIEF